jgi:hypothetical protein
MLTVDLHGLGLEALNYTQFYLQKGLRTIQSLSAPRFVASDALEFPLNSLIHYLPETETELGIAANHMFLRNVKGQIFAQSFEELAKLEGNPIRTTQQPSVLKAQYQRQYRRIRPIRNFDSADKTESAVLVANYAMLQHLYRYRPNWQTRLFEFNNLYSTLVAEIERIGTTSSRNQFLGIRLDTPIPLRQQFVLAEKSLTRQALGFFKNDTQLFLYHLWLWIGEARERSLLAGLSPTVLAKLNLMFIVAGRVVTLNLSVLEEWRLDKATKGARGIEPRQLQLRFVKFLETLYSLNTVASGDTAIVKVDELTGEFETVAEIEGDSLQENEELAALNKAADELEAEGELQVVALPEPELATDLIEPRQDSDVAPYAEGIIRTSESLMEVGIVSAAEHRRFQGLAESYRQLPNPKGSGTLEDLLRIDPAVVGTMPVKQVKDLAFVLDKSMLSSSITQRDSTYINKVMHADTANFIMQAQKTGVAVTGYSIEEVKDAANEYEIHSVRLTPVAGAPSTFRFKVPIINEQGIFVSNRVKLKLRSQRADLPIRKVAPNKVALTTYYGKVFVVRSTKKVDDYAEWLHRNIAVAIDIGTVKEPKYGRVFQHERQQPRIFSILAQRYRSFKIKQLEFVFDLTELEQRIGVKELDKALSRGEVPCVWSNGAFYGSLNDAGDLAVEGTDEITSIEELAEFDLSKAPIDIVDLRFMGKDVPVGFVLGYYLGLSQLLRMLKVRYRTVARGARMELLPDEFAIRFADYSLIIPRENRLACMLLGGYNSYHKQIANYSLEVFDQKDVYGAVFDRAGLTARYLREIDLMHDLFVEHIAEELLRKMGEPTTFKGLLYRSAELLLSDHHPKEIDGAYRRERGYERIPGHVYTALVRGLRQYKAKPVTSKAQVDISPNEVWQEIQSDSSVCIVEDSNPIQNLKEKENTTFSGTGGRSERSMVRNTRAFHKNDLGVISEATVDNGTVGVTAYLSANPKLADLRGTHQAETFDPNDPTSILSTSALISVGSTHDDMKRVNFINIQQSHVVATLGYEVSPLRTGYENAIAHRTDPLFSVTAKGKGKVIALSEDVLAIQYDDSSLAEDRIKIGREYGVVTGTTVPHDIMTDLKVGDRVDLDDVVAWNTGFYERDFLQPRQVVWKAGVIVRTALMELPITHEDSSTLSESLAQRITMNTSEVRELSLTFKQQIRNLVTVGQELSAEDILCIIVDDIGGNDLFDDQTTANLSLLSRNSPRSKYDGKVGKIEVFYRGELEDASATVRALISQADRERIRKAKALGQDPLTGEIEDLDIDTVLIRIYIDGQNGAADGDKVVFGNQMKSVVGQVMRGRNESLDGKPIDAIFGFTSIANRIVYSPFIMGTTIPLLRLITQRALKAYRGEGR